ncbi:MAG: redox-regulated ATPase YchF [bacterium]|nr:redox-regulated ATPase YchF [bacterium]
MEVGITGLAGSGKSTLFRLMTGVDSSSDSDRRSEPKVGVARVPDDRLDRLSSLYQPKKHTPAAIHYTDIPGVFSDGCEPGKLGTAKLRNNDLLMIVLRDFDSPVVAHPLGSNDPMRDLQRIEEEFLLEDQVIVEKRLDRITRELKRESLPELLAEKALLERCLVAFDESKPLREVSFSSPEMQKLRGFSLLSLKPVLIVFNADEGRFGEDSVDDARCQTLRERAETGCCEVCVTLESELAELNEDEANEFLQELNLTEPALNRVIRESYRLIGLISFFTVGEDECRAWSIREGSLAVEAAAAIHSDISRGFIRAEVIHYQDLLDAGSLAATKSNGTLRLEGKIYPVRDGDVVHFRFNV